LTNLVNITSTSPLPTDPLGVAIVIILSVVGLIVSGVGGFILIIKATEAIEGHFQRIKDIENRVWKLEEKSSVSQRQTGE